MSSSERLSTVEEVEAHIREHRSDLRSCVLAFSGGKDSVLLVSLIRRATGHDVPMFYVGCPGAEWPCHESFVRGFGAEIVDSGHGWDWWDRNAAWAFLHRHARLAERWARQHHRGVMRRIARSRGAVLLWGNRTADGNNVRAHRYRVADGTELWMPCRDLPDSAIAEVVRPCDMSPVYELRTTGASGYPPGRLRAAAPEERREEARDHLPRQAFQRFDRIFKETIRC